MDVILDTSIYVALLQSQGKEMFSSSAFLELFEYLRRTKSNLIIPDTVFEEITAKYSGIIEKSRKEALDAWVTLMRDGFLSVKGIYPEPPTATEQLKAFTEKLLNPGKGFEVRILNNYEEISLSDVVVRGVHRIAPASEKGEELRVGLPAKLDVQGLRV